MVENPTTYNRWDIARAMLVIGQSPMRLARGALAQRLELGEGAMRSVLDLLKQQHLLSATKRGHTLSADGEQWYRRITAALAPPIPIDFSPYLQRMFSSAKRFHSCALVLPHHPLPRGGTRERDLAVHEGAEGAVLLQKVKGKLRVPGIAYQRSFADIEKQITAENGDGVILTFAYSRRAAENAALRIAAAVHPTIRKQCELQ